MGTIFVQLNSEIKRRVVSVFGGPQNEEEHPHQGKIEDTDDRYIAFLTHAPGRGSPRG
ncbi:hypothetical protein [Pseudomonas sp. URMO17WK12:I12]|jgi:hypothetical protein|uniref:hypothetical protein n=1 Tax=Pseudomonas sp. URMO17WK12:I12 TaxID=1259797 RepID=UPI0012DE5E2F|nr:hypothetical protein [Pseudomonas sp. URMO17WK12:I12]